MRVDLSVGSLRSLRSLRLRLRFDGIGARAVTIGDRERDGGARPGRRGEVVEAVDALGRDDGCGS